MIGRGGRAASPAARRAPPRAAPRRSAWRAASPAPPAAPSRSSGRMIQRAMRSRAAAERLDAQLVAQVAGAAGRCAELGRRRRRDRRRARPRATPGRARTGAPARAPGRSAPGTSAVVEHRRAALELAERPVAPSARRPARARAGPRSAAHRRLRARTGRRVTYGPVTTRAPFAGAAAREVPARRVRRPGPAARRAAATPSASGSRTVPLEQIGQSAVKRLWRQKSEVIEARPEYRAPLPRSARADADRRRLRHPPGQSRRAPTCSSGPPSATGCSRRSPRADRLVLLGDVVELREAPARRRDDCRASRSSRRSARRSPASP